MTRRLLLIVAWLILGHAVAGGLYLALINLPESSVFMLGLSAVLALALLVVALSVHVGAIAAWQPEGPPVRALGGGVLRIAWALPALLVLGVFWWLGGRLDDWHTAHNGEIDAWFMAYVNLAETTWVHRGIDWLVFLLRYVVGVSLALACLVAGLRQGVRGLVSGAWIVRGIDPRVLGPMLVLELVLILLPWRVFYWRPAKLPPTIVEALFVGTKLALIALVVAVGWALLLKIPIWRALRGEPVPPPAS